MAVASLFLFHLCAAGAATNATAWRVRSWQTDEGLPNNSVTGVAQTADGYLWVATLGGLLRFNGSKFEEFSPRNFSGVGNRAIRRMYLDHRGRLWLAMDSGAVVCVDHDHARIYDQKDGLQNGTVSSIAEDSAGTVWVAGDAGLFSITREKVLPHRAAEGGPTGGNPYITTDAKGRLWCAQGAEVGLYRNGQWERLLHLDQAPVRLAAAHDGSMWICAGQTVLKYSEGGQPGECARLPDAAVGTMMFEDPKGVLWIGTTEGLFRLEEKELTRMDGSQGEIMCVMQDRENNLWIGTADAGLNLVYPKVVHLFGLRTGLPAKPTCSICQATNDDFWAALKNGSLMRCVNKQWDLVKSPGDGLGKGVTCVTPGKAGGVWIGTSDCGLQRWEDGKFRHCGQDNGWDTLNIRALLEGGNGDVWIATRGPDRLALLRTNQFRFLDVPIDAGGIHALAEGVDGAIWAGTTAGQLLRVNLQTLTVEPVVPAAAQVAVRDLHVTEDGSLWIGYAGLGLGRWWHGHYARITMKDGLLDDYISQIQSDHQGALWITSDRGLFQVDQAELVAVAEGRASYVRSIIHGRNEGLSNLQPAIDDSPNSWHMNNGEIWFATCGGLLLAKPGLIPDNTNAPTVVLERVAVDERTVAFRGSKSPLCASTFTNALDLGDAVTHLSLAPGRKVEFEFAALSFTSPENVKFRCHLENFDADWTPVTAQRSATYPRLPAGDYVFEVRACNNMGMWDEKGCNLAFTVPKFYWETWWFRSLALAAFTATVILLVRHFSFLGLQRKLARLREQAALQKERTRIARDIHDEVGAKLTRLSLLSELAGRQPDLSATARGEVSEIFATTRETILSFGQIIWAINPKNDTLVNFANYLCRFAEEFFDGSTVQSVCDLPARIPDLTVSTEIRHHLFLAVKEALNNVLKHSRARQVCLRLATEGDEITIVVEDDGCGFSAGGPPGRAGEGNGLENMRARMKTVGGAVAVESRPGRGSRVTFQIPLHRSAEVWRSS